MGLVRIEQEMGSNGIGLDWMGWDWMGLDGIAWNCMELHGTAWGCMGFNGGAQDESGSGVGSSRNMYVCHPSPLSSQGWLYG